jgi:archaellum component FlaC
MNEDYKELIEYLDGKFQKLATKEDLANFVSLEEFDQFRKETNKNFSDLKESLNALTTSIDNLVKIVNDLTQEYASVTSKVDRHEKWLQQLAQKLDIKLEY